MTRLIDADELKKQLKRGFDTSDYYTEHDQFIVDVCQLLDNAPTVERPQGDLISRNALLETFSNSQHIKETTTGLDVMEMLAIKEVIENSPTVDIPNYGGQVVPDTLQGWRYEERPQSEWVECINTNAGEYDEGFNAGYAAAIKNIPEYRKLADKLQRPQGEWKEHYGLYICSECGQIIGEYKKNYCATCGADMRGGKND